MTIFSNASGTVGGIACNLYGTGVNNHVGVFGSDSTKMVGSFAWKILNYIYYYCTIFLQSCFERIMTDHNDFVQL